MKKHITIIALALISLATVFSGCGKDKDDNNKQKYTVRYELDNEKKDNLSHVTLSSCFKANITYTDVNGNSVELKDITLPWQKEITVEAPFDASVQIELTFNENELPETVSVVKAGRIEVKKANDGEEFFVPHSFGNLGTTISKENFIQKVQERPDYLKFDGQHSIKE